jgi:hypothetical protein
MTQDEADRQAYHAYLETLPPNFEVTYSGWREDHLNHHAHIHAYRSRIWIAAYRQLVSLARDAEA